MQSICRCCVDVGSDNDIWPLHVLSTSVVIPVALTRRATDAVTASGGMILLAAAVLVMQPVKHCHWTTVEWPDREHFRARGSYPVLLFQSCGTYEAVRPWVLRRHACTWFEGGHTGLGWQTIRHD